MREQPPGGVAGDLDMHTGPTRDVMARLQAAAAALESGLRPLAAERPALEAAATGPVLGGHVSDKFLENYNTLAPGTEELAAIAGPLLNGYASLGNAAAARYEEVDAQAGQVTKSVAQGPG